MTRAKKKKSLVIGLTGGPGVGKSEVAGILESRGARIINADKIGHEILANDRTARRKLVNLLGSGIVTSERALDRRKIGAIVFGDLTRMRQFNSIVHPLLLKRLKKAIGLEISGGAGLIVVDAALIFEWGIADWFDLILVIQARRALRLRRMMKQALSKSQAARRISSQMSQRDKVALADYVIENNSARRHLRRKTLEFYNLIKRNYVGIF